jgi:hypothetical protein
LVPQPVSCAPHLIPGNFRAKQRTLFAQPDGRFADHQRFSFDGGNRFSVLQERLEIHARGEFLDHADCI